MIEFIIVLIIVASIGLFFIYRNKKESVYDREYFIKKFEAIPEEEWGLGYDGNCALMHSGYEFTEYGGITVKNEKEVGALIKLFGGDSSKRHHNLPNALFDDARVVYVVNDGNYPSIHPGSTPKQRVLNYLYSL